MPSTSRTSPQNWTTLNLSIYTPSLYLHDSARNSYTIDYEGSGLSIDGREKGLRNLMATNLLKRLESSVNSFRLTLERIKAYIDETILLIDQEAEETMRLLDSGIWITSVGEETWQQIRKYSGCCSCKCWKTLRQPMTASCKC